MKPRLAALLLLPTVALPVPFLVAWREATPFKSMSVGVLDDRLDSVPGAVVRVSDGTLITTVVTNEQGQTPWLTMDPSAGVQIVLGEGATSSGKSLGLIEELVATPLQDQGDDEHQWLILRTQPRAEPILVDGKPNTTVEIRPAGSFPHWVIVLPEDSELRFSSHVGTLMDGETVDQYMAYRGQSGVQPSDYIRGAVMMTPTVQTGAGGFVVGIHLHGDVAPSNVAVDVYNFYTGVGSVPIPPLTSEIIDVVGDRVYVSVKGGVIEGQLALLVRPEAGTPGETLYVPDAPPDLEVPEDGGGGQVAVHIDSKCACDGVGEPTVRSASGSAAPLVRDCEPDPPEQPTNWSCDPSPPMTGDTCPGAIPGPIQCKITRMASPRVCKSAGGQFSVRQATIQSFKVTFEFTGEAGMGQNKLSTTSGWEYGRTSETVTTDSWQADNGGEGLGECLRWWRFYLTCVKLWTVPTHEHTYVLGAGDTFIVQECSGTGTTATACTDLALSDSECYRTSN